jgi:hypothetical protein
MKALDTFTSVAPSSSRSGRPTARPRHRASLGLAVAALALSFMAACSDSASGTTGGSGGSGASVGTGGTGGTAPVPGADLDGTWQSVCYMKTQTSLTYANLALTGTYTEYSDDACTTPYHVSKWTGTGMVTGETASGDTKLDLSFASFKSTSLTAENAAFNNMNQYCGATDWAANVEKDVLGKDCYGFSIPVGGESLDIYRVEGTTLKLGQGAKIGVELTEADRPAAIDETRVFTRK